MKEGYMYMVDDLLLRCCYTQRQRVICSSAVAITRMEGGGVERKEVLKFNLFTFFSPSPRCLLIY